MKLYLLTEWCFTPLSTVFQSYHSDSSHYSCLSRVSPVLGMGSEVSCPRHSHDKPSEDPVQLEPRTPGLQVKHLTTEPRKIPSFTLNYRGGLVIRASAS